MSLTVSQFTGYIDLDIWNRSCRNRMFPSGDPAWLYIRAPHRVTNRGRVDIDTDQSDRCHYMPCLDADVYVSVFAVSACIQDVHLPWSPESETTILHPGL